MIDKRDGIANGDISIIVRGMDYPVEQGRHTRDVAKASRGLKDLEKTIHIPRTAMPGQINHPVLHCTM